MACQPSEMSGRNWMMRRMLIDAVRKDPDWKGGDYDDAAARGARRQCLLRHRLRSAARRRTTRPRRRGRRPTSWSTIASPRPSPPTRTTSSTSGSPRATTTRRPAWAQIRAAVLAINSADDERNPPELGIMERELPRIKGARLYLIPASEETRGHGTTGDGALLEDAAGGLPGVGAETLSRSLRRCCRCAKCHRASRLAGATNAPPKRRITARRKGREPA